MDFIEEGRKHQSNKKQGSYINRPITGVFGHIFEDSPQGILGDFTVADASKVSDVFSLGGITSLFDEKFTQQVARNFQGITGGENASHIEISAPSGGGSHVAALNRDSDGAGSMSL